MDHNERAASMPQKRLEVCFASFESLTPFNADCETTAEPLFKAKYFIDSLLRAVMQNIYIKHISEGISDRFVLFGCIRGRSDTQEVPVCQ